MSADDVAYLVEEVEAALDDHLARGSQHSRKAAPGTPLDFDINSTGMPSDPMLMLVEPGMLSSHSACSAPESG